MEYGATNSEIQTLSNQLFSAILLEQKKFMQLRPAQDTQKLESMLEHYAKYRGRKFAIDYISTGRGHGPFTECLDGSIKYDLINGIGPNLLGHSHPLQIRSNLEAAQQDSLMCGNLQPYPQALELAKSLVKSVEGSRLSHCWLSGSGSMANDIALKLIWQKKAPQYKLIAFKGGFAGRSICTQDITDVPKYREGMPTSIQVEHVPHWNWKDPENSLKNTLDALDKIWASDPDNFCGLSIELVQGEAGFVFGTKAYYEGLFKWAKDKNLMIWVDEVQTFARTQQLFAFQHFGLQEYVDVVTVGKVLQACATLYSSELNPRPGLISGTFNGSIATLLYAKNILAFLNSGVFYGPNGRIAQIEELFKQIFKRLQKKYSKDLAYYDAIGTMVSFEVGNSDQDSTSTYLKSLFKNGIIAFTAGNNPTRIRFLLPLCLSNEHIAEIEHILDKTFAERC